MTAAVRRQVRVAEMEATFALTVTLAVCVRTEWAHGPNGVAMATVLPVAMAFSVHGLHNAAGLGRWNLLYIPLRLTALIAGLAYSYSHYLAMLPPEPLEVAGRDIRWLVAVVVELLTVSALVAYQGHTTRLDADDDQPVDGQELVDEPPAPTAPGRSWPGVGAGAPARAPPTGRGLSFSRVERRGTNQQPNIRRHDIPWLATAATRSTTPPTAHGSAGYRASTPTSTTRPANRKPTATAFRCGASRSSSAGPAARRSEVDHIRFPAREAPAVDPTGELVITNLIGRHWENQNDYGYTSGIALSADAVPLQARPPRHQRPTTGHRRCHLTPTLRSDPQLYLRRRGPGLDAMDAELLDRPVGQGLRARQSQPPTATLLILTEDQIAGGIVGRPLTHVRPVEQPTNPKRPTHWMPWASLTLSAVVLLLVGALLAVLYVPPVVGAMLTLCTVLCCVGLVAAEVASKAAR